MNCFCLILVLSTPATGGVLMSYGILSDSCISSEKNPFCFFFFYLTEAVLLPALTSTSSVEILDEVQ